MEDFPNGKLFLDRFVAYNKRRFEDDPEAISILNEVNVNSVSISNLRKSVDPEGHVKHTVDMDFPDKMKARNQSFLPAVFYIHGAAEILTPSEFVPEGIGYHSTAGVYMIKDDQEIPRGFILVNKGEKTSARVLELIDDACLFVLEGNEITLNPGLTAVSIDSLTIVGNLTIVESEFTRGQYYNGEFLHDGTITY